VYALAATIEHVRINHRRPHILMSEQFLNGANVVAGFEQVRGEAVAQRVTATGLAGLLTLAVCRARLTGYYPVSRIIPPISVLSRQPDNQ
jgi:hypothetical protein